MIYQAYIIQVKLLHENQQSALKRNKKITGFITLIKTENELTLIRKNLFFESTIFFPHFFKQAHLRLSNINLIFSA